MIVRDEAALLPDFLNGVADLWNELIVVDTGSIDDSREIVQAAGGRIIEEPWRDDFAEARNIGLCEATGAWVLVLDADEMVSPTAAASIRACVHNDKAGAARVLMRNHMPHGHKRDTHLLRLFRNDPSIRFEYPIHETVARHVASYLDRSGLQIFDLDGEIKHLGYVRDRAAAKNKKERDLQILLHCTLANPRDFYSWFKILELARFWQDEPLWKSVAQRLHQALEATQPSLVDTHFGGEFITLIADRAFTRKEEALAFLMTWQQRIAPSAEYLMRRGELKEELGDIAGALKDFEHCLRLSEITSNLQMASVRPHLALARLQMAEGDLRGAEDRVRLALKQSPRDPEALFAAVALRTQNAVSSHSELADELAREHGGSPELHLALGEMALLQGRAATAVEEFRMAAGKPPSGQPALRLAQALLAFGQPDAARELAERLIDEMPEAALGVLVADLVEGHDSDIKIELELDEASAALRDWVDTVINARHAEVVHRLKVYAPAVADIFPWLPPYLDAA